MSCPLDSIEAGTADISLGRTSRAPVPHKPGAPPYALSLPPSWRCRGWAASGGRLLLSWRDFRHLDATRAGSLWATGPPDDPSVADVFIPHPVYSAQGWVAVVNPGEATTDEAISLLQRAHESARRRVDRREVSRDAT